MSAVWLPPGVAERPTVTMRARASAPQVRFVTSEAPFPAFVAGFGSGKTEAAILRVLDRKFRYPSLNVGYYLPTYDLVSMIAMPRIIEKLNDAKVKFTTNKQRHYIDIKNKGKIFLRSMDAPEKIVGYEVADSLVDELDILPQDVADLCWVKIIARNRQKKRDGKPNTVGVATTPEGFRFVYERWQKDPKPGYELIRASTYSNALNLPEDYIINLLRSYPRQLIRAYLEGEFVNMTSGTVYPDFDREKNACTDTFVNLPDWARNGWAAPMVQVGDTGQWVQSPEARQYTPEMRRLGMETVHVGADFNVWNGHAVLAAVRDDSPYIMGELVELRDTPAMIAALKERFPDRHICIYPDASGDNAKSTNASISDVALLRQAGFEVRMPAKNPRVKDRVAAVNQLICNGLGQRRLRVNVKACPKLAMCLEQQVYDKNGEPDKSNDRDHLPDALGYMCHFLWPVLKPVSTQRHNVDFMSR